MRAVPVVLAAAALLLAAPGAASADVIFDPADADELAATLAEATAAQNVCYGWDVQVDDPVSGTSSSVGSDRGAGVPVDDSSCAEWVRFDANITYTSESSESEDSASYDVSSSSGGPGRTDLDALGLDFGGLTGEDPDVVIGKAVAALPLLAADKGLADPIEATPETGAAPADAQPTGSPGSDWWRNNGGMVMWGVGLLLAAGVFAWWVLRSSRSRPKPVRSAPSPHVPDTVPAEFYQQYDQGPASAEGTPPRTGTPSEPVTEPFTRPIARPVPPPEGAPPAPAGERSAGPTPPSAPGAGPRPESAPSPAPGSAGTEQAPPSGADPAPRDQKDKE